MLESCATTAHLSPICTHGRERSSAQTRHSEWNGKCFGLRGRIRKESRPGRFHSLSGCSRNSDCAWRWSDAEQIERKKELFSGGRLDRNACSDAPDRHRTSLMEIPVQYCLPGEPMTDRIVFLSLVCGLFAATVTAHAAAPSIDGVWRAGDHGQVLEVNQNTLRVYEITGGSCIEAGGAEGGLGWGAGGAGVFMRVARGRA